MGENDRLLGQLEQFMKTTEQDLREIKACLEDLKAFKWKVLGGAAVISAIVSALGRFL